MHHTHSQDQQALSPVQGHIDMNNRHKCFSLLYNCRFFLLNCNSDQNRLKFSINIIIINNISNGFNVTWD